MTSFTGMEPITPVVQLLLPANGPKDEGKELKSKSLSFLLFGGIASIMLIGGYESSDIGVSVFGGCMLLVVILSAIQYGIQKRVATMMRAASIDGDSSEMTEDTKICAQIPPFRMDVYEQNELSGNGFKLNQSLSETENIFGLTPLRIFYFFNFYSTNSLLNKVSGGFRRHGTVFYLGSPADIAFSKFFHLFSIKKIMKRLLIKSPQELAEAIDHISQKPLPPKSRGLLSEDYFHGAYPCNTFYCTDGLWKKCVVTLFTKTDFSIIDASGYSKERAGLQWEIGEIVNHVATKKAVVLIDSKTDLPALGESFRQAWLHMSASSPNIGNPDPLRFIFVQPPTKQWGPREHKNPLKELAHQQALSNDNIIAFMLKESPAPAQ